MERINVRVEGSVKQRLEADAKQKGTSPSAIVRQLIEEHYGQPVVENCLQLAERLGILGSIKGLPADLTTNPEHMEGFGRD